MIMQQLFKEFEANNIGYVHFKSNCHLDDSFLGYGDFDVLINAYQLSDVESIILKNNGKRFNSYSFGRYPGVDNWLIFDESTGEIKHLHLHCQLATGKSLVKEYIIPWSDIILATRVKDSKWDIFVTDPNLEILLLLVRAVVKSKAKDLFRARIGCYIMHEDLMSEWQELKKLISYEKVDEYIDELFPKNVRVLVKLVIREKNISSKNFLRLNKSLRNMLNYNKRMSSSAASVQMLYQNQLRKLQIVLKWHTPACFTIQKTGIAGGRIIAFVGVDGAGKSTTTTEIQKWLQRKIECKRFYMGAGDGNKPLYVRLFDSVMKLLRAKSVSNKKDTNKMIKNKEVQEDKKISLFGIIKKRIWCSRIFSIEKRNKKNLLRMNRYRLNGGISLLDRYPQIELSDKNDGPKLDTVFRGIRRNKIINKLYMKEVEYLSVVKEIKPDIIFRLNITAEESMKRKPEQSDIGEFQDKIDDLRKITFQGANIVDIDASKPYEEELLEIKKVIWEIL